MGQVVALYICSDKGKPMTEVERVNALEGLGLEGDRYALGTGAFSRSKRETIRHVSLIAFEAIELANLEAPEPFSPKETRRNIVVIGVDLNKLVGVEFAVGGVRMKGVELCDPCDRPSTLSKKPQFAQAFENRGGLRAAILSSGQIKRDDEVVVF